MNVDTSKERFIPLRKVCELIQLKANTVRSWAKAGKIVSIKSLIGKKIFI